MHTTTLLILFIPYIIPTLTTPLPFPPLQPLSPTISLSLFLPTPNLTTTPLHNALLNITTYPSHPLPSPLWRHVLAAAHLQTVTLHGDREIVQEPYRYHEGGCYFRAESVPGVEEKRLTYGTLEEGIRVLAGFLGGVGGVGAEGVFVEGRGRGRGRAIGVMGIGVRGGEGVRGGGEGRVGFGDIV